MFTIFNLGFMKNLYTKTGDFVACSRDILKYLSLRSSDHLVFCLKLEKMEEKEGFYNKILVARGHLRKKIENCWYYEYQKLMIAIHKKTVWKNCK